VLKEIATQPRIISVATYLAFIWIWMPLREDNSNIIVEIKSSLFVDCGTPIEWFWWQARFAPLHRSWWFQGAQKAQVQSIAKNTSSRTIIHLGRTAARLLFTWAKCVYLTAATISIRAIFWLLSRTGLIWFTIITVHWATYFVCVTFLFWFISRVAVLPLFTACKIKITHQQLQLDNLALAINGIGYITFRKQSAAFSKFTSISDWLDLCVTGITSFFHWTRRRNRWQSDLLPHESLSHFKITEIRRTREKKLSNKMIIMAHFIIQN
jgi:hypothetical protein